MTGRGYVGRFAPSPTGLLHFGSLVAALASWLRARAALGEWLIRIEDIDPPREVAGASAAIIEALEIFGLRSDRPIVLQSQRIESYRAALNRLRAAGAVFPCSCSRTRLAPHGGRHRGVCSPPDDDQRAVSWRLAVGDSTIRFSDVVQGEHEEFLIDTAGDFVVWRNVDLPSYQLAVVVDDAAQGVTEVVRGADLLDSTARQILLQHKLGVPTPNYLHVPLAIAENGQKLSKQNFAPAIESRDCVPTLRRALAFLGQDAEGLDAQHPTELLRQAVSAFRTELIPGRLQIAV